MNAFEYASPASVELAIKALAGSDSSEALAGGTDLINRMKDYVSSPKRVVDLRTVKDLAGISGEARSEGLVLGACTRLVDIVNHKGIAEAYPALRQAALEVGTPQIRNVATLGGNLLQRPRCWYYRAGHGLLAMKDGKSLVREGDNRYHAIFLTDGNALFVSPSSLATPLIALGAQATVVGPSGERTVPVEALYQAPKTDQDRELTVAPGELLTKVTIPPPKGRNASYEVRAKQSHDWALVRCSTCLEMDGDTVRTARVVIYGVAPTPWRSEAAEKAIQGKTVTRENASAAGQASVEGAQPLSMNAYKVPLTKTVVQRALLAAVGDRYWEEA